VQLAKSKQTDEILTVFTTISDCGSQITLYDLPTTYQIGYRYAHIFLQGYSRYEHGGLVSCINYTWLMECSRIM